MKQQLPFAIVGSGGASFHAIKALRHFNPEREIHLFTDQSEPPYNPMLLTYLIAGKISLVQCLIGGKDFYEKYSVNVHEGSPVVDLNVKEKKVSNAKGESLEYHSCLISSGASAIKPTFSTSNFKSYRIFTLRTLNDAIRLREFLLNAPKRVLIVGASMIGIKLVEIFRKANSEVYFADMASQVFPLTAHTECATLIEEELNRNDIRLLLNQRIIGMEETRSSVKVSLTASELEVDGVILCIGVKPNLDFVRPSEIQMDKGILVDENMQTSASEIYAAGDVAQATNCLKQTRELIPLWANACHQGRVAGSNMVKVRDVFPGSIPQNITHFFNLFFVSIGDTRNYDEVQKQIDAHSTQYTFKSQGKTVGLNLLSVEDCERINAVGILRQEIMRNINGGIR